MTSINPNAETARENAREAGGQFGVQQHTAPDMALIEPAPLASEIGDYLREYAAEEAAYAEDGEGPDHDEAYERWEDFRTDNAEKAYALLESSKKEIERLQEALAAAEAKHAIPQELVEAIEKDHEHYEQPVLYVPEDGHQDGYVDVIAASDGVHRKYTVTPDGGIERNFD